jgi:hypothetical protein
MAQKLVHLFGAFIGPMANDISGKLLSLGRCGDWTFEAPVTDETPEAAEARIRVKRFAREDAPTTCKRCARHEAAGTFAPSVAKHRAERAAAIVAALAAETLDETQAAFEADAYAAANENPDADETDDAPEAIEETDYSDLLDE